MLYIVLSAVIAFVVSAVIFFYIGIGYRKKIAESKVSSAEEQAKKIVEDGKRDVERLKKEMIIQAKDEMLAQKDIDRRNCVQRREVF